MFYTLKATALVLICILYFSCKKKDAGPPAPTGITITNISDTGCIITWRPVSNANGYLLYLSPDSSFKDLTELIGPKQISATTIQLDSLQPFTKYFVRLRTVVGNNVSDFAVASFKTLDADKFVLIGGEDGMLYALDGRSGNIKWTYGTGGPIYATPSIKNGIVYIGSWDRYVYAIEAEHGITKWKTYTENTIYTSTPLVANGMVYIGTYAGNLYAFDALTGSVKWMYTIQNPYINIGSSPVIKDSVVYIGSYDNNLYALNANNGSHIWTAKGGNPVMSSPALYNNTIYIGWNVYLNAFDPATGAQLWSSFVDNSSVVSSSPTVSNGIVYIGAPNGNMFAFDANNGAQIWKVQLGLNASIVSSPVVVNNTLYIGSGDGIIYAMDPLTGSVKWSNNIGNSKNIYSGPVVSVNTIRNTVYAGTLDGHVVAIDANTGATRWVNSIGPRFSSSPCIMAYSGKVFYPGISGDMQ
jgi:outer membrane protein assembly factor BamB